MYTRKLSDGPLLMRTERSATRSGGAVHIAGRPVGFERLTGALLDRLTHHVNILEMNGDSYRLTESRHRKNATIN